MTDSDTVDFEAVDLAFTIEKLSQHELDRLPFGVILLDPDGLVRFYSATEGRQSGFDPAHALGQNFWQIARCFDTDAFRGRIEEMLESGSKVELEVGWVGDFSNHRRELRVRVQSARTGGVWIFIQRDRQTHEISVCSRGLSRPGSRSKDR